MGPRGRREGVLEIALRGDGQGLFLHRDGSCARREGFQLIRWSRRIPDHRYPRELGVEVLEELEPFAAEAGLVEKCSCHVSAGPGEARDETRGHRVALQV